MQNYFSIENLDDVEIVSSETAIKERDQVIMASKINHQMVASDTELQNAAHRIKELRALIRLATSEAQKVKRPFTDRANMVKEILSNFLGPVEAELKRLQELSGPYALEQRRKVEKEREENAQKLRELQEQKRRQSIEAQTADSSAKKSLASTLAVSTTEQIRDVASKPKPKPVSGVTIRKTLSVTIISADALYQSRPDLCSPPKPIIPEIKRVIKSLPEGESLPGIEFHWSKNAII